MDFLQKPLAWFSSLYIRVQSKICGRNSFCLFFLSEFFRISSEKFFRLLAKKRQNFVKTTFYVSRGTICGLNFFLSFESFPIFCSNHWHGSQNSIYVSGVKNAEKNMFFFVFLFRIFSNFERYIFRLLAKTLQKFSKLSSACPEEPIVAWIFLKFWIVSDFLQKPLAWFSKFYLRVQSKNCGKNGFFCFSFHNFFFEFWAIYFQIFGQNTSKVFKSIFCASRGTICAFKFFLKVLNRYGISAGTFGMVLNILSTCPE